MKIIAFYLPQFHEVKENNEWWGEGFTEWTNVKSSKPTFKGHNMPRVPLNKNYYNLTDNSTLRWQADLAKKYGIYGFAYYHYWGGVSTYFLYYNKNRCKEFHLQNSLHLKISLNQIMPYLLKLSILNTLI